MYEKFWDDICEQNGFTKVPKYKLNFEGKKIEDVFIKIWDKDTPYSYKEMLTMLKDKHNSIFQDNRKNNNQQDEKLKIIFGLDSSREEIKINCDLGALQEKEITNEGIKKAIRKVNPDLEKDFEKDLEIKINRSEKQAEIKHPEYLETIIVNYKPDLIKTIKFQVFKTEESCDDFDNYPRPEQSLIKKIKDINSDVEETFLNKLNFKPLSTSSSEDNAQKYEFFHPDCNGSVIFKFRNWTDEEMKGKKTKIRNYYFEEPQEVSKLNFHSFKPTRF
ncbi:MAG: hypothetical protein ACQKHC_01055 [Candidatus Phytoplasma pruni]